MTGYYIPSHYLSLALAASTMVEVAVYADPRRHLAALHSAYSVRPLITGATFLALLHVRVTVELGDLVPGHPGQAVQAVRVLADDVLDVAELHQLVDSLVCECRTEFLERQIPLVIVLTHAWE